MEDGAPATNTRQPEGRGHEPNPLRRWFDARKPEDRLTHKWDHYFDIYHRHLGGLRDRAMRGGGSPTSAALRVLEVGVFCGGSLEMWRDYFGGERRVDVHGVDVNPGALVMAKEGRFKVHIGDQGDAAFWRSLKESEREKFDVIIDDGGHTMVQQVTTFREMFPHLSDHGVYICEDVHTSYWKNYGGGLHRAGTFVEVAKGLVDGLNGWHVAREAPGSGLLGENTYTIGSIHFYDSVIVIEKKPRSAQPPFDVHTGERRLPGVPGFCDD